ncbi:DgyrCDS11111 [Dimorphilus gyrociliatus]|uniref:DgyrCDS11111 n=1 Tax=Dimorphilus gyrociliatus TaxID=2664684 RepID=A0A7I8W489_9ANNE|nr:DgyrCDS11111 [Dimorphilus gyrociliatus]
MTKSEIFIAENGKPLKFYLSPCDIRDSLRKKIMDHGGELVFRNCRENVIKLTSPGSQASKGEVSIDFIHESIAKKKKLNLDDYTNKSSDQEVCNDVMAAVSPKSEQRVIHKYRYLANKERAILLRNFRRQAYTRSDDEAIIKYVWRSNGARLVRGRSLWTNLQDKLPKQLRGRTWMSLRERYLKIILPNLKNYQLAQNQYDILSQAKREDSSKSYSSLNPGSFADDSDDEEGVKKHKPFREKSVKILNKSDKLLTESPAITPGVKRKANALKVGPKNKDFTHSVESGHIEKERPGRLNKTQLNEENDNYRVTRSCKNRELLSHKRKKKCSTDNVSVTKSPKAPKKLQNSGNSISKLLSASDYIEFDKSTFQKNFANEILETSKNSLGLTTKAMMYWAVTSVKLATDGKQNTEESVYEDLGELNLKDSRHTHRYSDSATLTDICCNRELDEVSLVSLIKETIPQYRLRADTFTDFGGYANSDWIHTPVLPSDHDLPLSVEVIEETLNYFILCGDRLTQMTKTYNDIDAVTHLLEEKEKDLELAARIGQSLLERNKQLESLSENLECQLEDATEKSKQLQHELCMKDSLLHSYLQSDQETDVLESEQRKSDGRGVVYLEALQKKVNFLERENECLKERTVHCLTDTDQLVSKEEALVQELMKELEVSRTNSNNFQTEVANHLEIIHDQEEKILFLENEISLVRETVKKLSDENNELIIIIEHGKETERLLSIKLTEAAEKLNEMEISFEEKCRELNDINLRSMSDHCSFHYSSNTESLLNELRTSVCKDPNDPDGKFIRQMQTQQENAISTLKCVNKSQQSEFTYEMSQGCLNQGSMFFTDCDRESSMVSEQQSQNSWERELGNFSSRRCSSFGADFSSKSSVSLPGLSSIFRHSEKLQLIKPIKGSITMEHWQRLAHSDLTTILNFRPGITSKFCKEINHSVTQDQLLPRNFLKEKRSSDSIWKKLSLNEESTNRSIGLNCLSDTKSFIQLRNLHNSSTIIDAIGSVAGFSLHEKTDNRRGVRLRYLELSCECHSCDGNNLCDTCKCLKITSYI